jgi:hypothetical protein
MLAILIALSNPFTTTSTSAVPETPAAHATATPTGGCSLMDPRCYRALSLPSPGPNGP